MAERDRRPTPRDRTTLQLEHVEGIRVGDQMITAEDLAQDGVEVGNVHPVSLARNLSPSEQVELVSDEFILRNIVLGMLPLTITGDPQEPPVVLIASLDKFTRPSYSNALTESLAKKLGVDPSGKESIAYSVRLIPEAGKVARIAYRDFRRLSSWGLQEFSATHEVVTMNLHNLVYAEIYYNPQDKSQLLPLTRPEDRRK